MSTLSVSNDSRQFVTEKAKLIGKLFNADFNEPLIIPRHHKNQMLAIMCSGSVRNHPKSAQSLIDFDYRLPHKGLHCQLPLRSIPSRMCSTSPNLSFPHINMIDTIILLPLRLFAISVQQANEFYWAEISSQFSGVRTSFSSRSPLLWVVYLLFQHILLP